MFRFKRFEIEQDRCAMKVGTDGVLLGAWARGGSTILDVGTGTGVVALMMAQRYPEVSVTAIDIDSEAVEQARENICHSPFADRVDVMLQRVQDHEGCYDAIVSNPPFFIDSLAAPDRQRRMARHADTLTYGELMHDAARLLSMDGELSVVVPFDYRRRMEDEAAFCGFFPCRVCGVKTVDRKPVRRYLLSFRKRPCTCVTESLTIGDARYQELTQDFYL